MKSKIVMTLFLRVLAVVVLITVMCGCTSKEPKEVPVVLTVGSRSVTLPVFEEGFRRIVAEDHGLSSEEMVDLKRSYLRQVIDRELALAEADRLGVVISPGELEQAVRELGKDYPAGEFEKMLQAQGLTLDQWKRDLIDRLLLEKVVRQEVYSQVQLSQEEIEAYYKEHRKSFLRPEQVRARQIVVATEEEGQRLLGRLRQGEDFSTVARAHSLSPDSERGGDLDFFSRGVMPEAFDEVVFRLPVGRLSDLVKTDYGYHIFLVEEKRKAVRMSLDQVEKEIKDVLRSEKENRDYQEWLLGLGSRTVIEVDWAMLDGAKDQPK